MIGDRREKILVRLLEIAKDLTGINSASRNKDEMSDRLYPSISVLDADEQAAQDITPSGRGRGKARTRMISMSPEVWIKLGAKQDTIGTDLNLLRARWIQAVLTDEQLEELVGENGDMDYLGCLTELGRGRQVIGEISVAIAFIYPMNPTQLVA